MTGKLITVEGCDGSGKGELLVRLERTLLAMGYDVVRTREPGNCQNGEQIREILWRSPGTHAMAVGQVNCLMLYDHIGHVDTIVKPALEQGKWVLSDRYADSEFAYASERPGVEPILEAFWKFYGPMPDVTVLLVGDVREMLARAKSRDMSPDAEEPGKQNGKRWAKAETQLRIQNAYLRNLAGQPRTVIVDTRSKSPDEVFEEGFDGMMAKLASPPPIIQPSMFESLAVQ